MEESEYRIWTDEHGAVFGDAPEGIYLLHCPDVEEYVIPDQVKYISPDAFEAAPRLRKIDFNKVLSIPAKIRSKSFTVSEFHGSSWTGDFETVIHNYIYSIFENCPLVEEIKLNGSMFEIGKYVFAGLQHLKSFTIPYTERVFCIKALWGCNQLKELTINDNFIMDYGDVLGDSSEYSFETNRDWDFKGELPALETCRLNLPEYYCLKVIEKCLNFENVKTIILPSEVLKKIEDKLPNKDSINYVGE